MNIPLKPDRYHPLSIGMHWLMLVLLVAVYTLIELRGVFPKGTPAHDAMKTWHFMLGMSVLVLVLARIAMRFVFPAPAITPAPPRWQHIMAASMHLAIYAFLVVMPLLGWLTLSAKGRVIPFFGLELPALIGVDRGLAHDFEEIHELIGVIGYWLFGLHAAAALVHHYFMHDDTLRRMLPRVSSKAA